MSNALSATGGPPPAPNPQPQDGPPNGGNALTGAPSQSGQASGQQQAAPAPGHQQVVAALRHFDAIERELGTLLADPDLGKADLKSKIIDGATKLVSSGMVTAAQAVTQLGTVPERPFDQKKWVETQFLQTIQASHAVLDHHRRAFQGHGPSDPGHVDDHLSTMSGLMSQYKGGGNG